MKLSEVITVETIKVPLKATEKTAAIEELVDVLDKASLVPNKAELLKAILEREAIRTTGIGQGLALPHGKLEGLDKLIIAVGKPASSIDFQSIDQQPVNLIVLLASPVDQTGPHIQALARISRFMTLPEFRERIARAATADEVYQTFVEHEK
jgi:fructose-specific phosphotransferase system IIA component